MRKKVLKLILGFILLFVVGYFVLFWYICEASKIHFDIPKIAKEIKESKPIDTKIDLLLDSLKPVDNKRFALYREKMFAMFIGSEYYLSNRNDFHKDSYSEDVLDVVYSVPNSQKWINLFDKNFVFACGIEKYVDAKTLRNYYFQNNRVQFQKPDSSYILCNGIDDVAKFKYNRSISELETKELIGVLILTDRDGILYKKNAEKFEIKIKILEERLKMKRPL
jgi:hypothetical protein